MTQPVSPRVRRAESAPSSASGRSTQLQWIAATPALLALAAVLLFGLAVLGERTDRIDLQYQQDAQAALNTGGFKTARICYERLLQLHPGSDLYSLGLARSLVGMKQNAEAAAVLRLLAPADRAGYAPAHLLLAQMVLDASHEPAAIALAERHLRLALQADPANNEARLLLESVYANTGRSPSEATSH
jgi:thioredoxin-like negative regulator of GroEL